MDKDLIQAQEEFKPTITQLIEDQTKYDPFKDDTYLTEGTFLLSRFSKASKTIEDQRVAFTKPLNESLKSINTFFKTFSTPIKEADSELRNKLAKHRREMEYKRLEAQMKVEENNKKLVEEAKAKGLPIIDPSILPVVPDMPKTVGGVTVKKVWTFNIDDKTKVPQEYLVVDETKIRTAIRQGVREIAGVTIYQKDEVSL
jgi:hypothetical protein